MARTKTFDQEQALEKAMQLFWTKGYFDTSINDLVNATGLNRSSLYDTYGDKHQLYLLALKKYKQDMGSAMKELIDSPGSIKETLNKLFIYAAKESLEDKLNRGCFMINTTIEVAPHVEELQALVKDNQKDIEKAFRKVLKKGQKSGEISQKHSAKALSRFLYNTYAGLKVIGKSNPSEKGLLEVVKVAISALD